MQTYPRPHLKSLLLLAALPVLAFGSAPEPKKDEPPTPATVEELEKAIFRASSIAKSFVALAVLKLQEEGMLHLDDRLRDLVGDIEFANPWEVTDPVRLAHVLEHTAGFDDFTVRHYAASGLPDSSLRDALVFDPRPRTSRWRPGRFMSYTNAGPLLAAYAIERVTGRTFEQYVDEAIFKPLEMTTASFLLTDAVTKNLAKGYRSDGATEVPYWHVLGRPIGALNTTPTELAHFVQLLLGRGSYQGVSFLAPESIDRMETPTTSAASRKGLRRGYGLGNFMTSYKSFRFQGHNGGGPGFLADYAYAPEHGVGYVLMINSDSFEAVDRIDKLVRGYLTLELVRPTPPTAVVPGEELQAFAGYYEPYTPRIETLRFMDRLLGLQHIAVDGGALRARSLSGPPKLLIPVDDKGLFRGEEDPVATMAFLQDDGELFLDGGLLFMGNYRQVPAWWVWGQGAIALLCLVLMFSAVLFPLVWVPRKLLGRMKGVQHMNVRLLPLAAVLCLVAAFGLFLTSMASDPIERLGNPTVSSVGFCVFTWLFVVTTIAGFMQALRASRWDVRPAVRRHALLVSVANIIVLAYLAYWGIIGLRTWA